MRGRRRGVLAVLAAGLGLACGPGRQGEAVAPGPGELAGASPAPAASASGGGVDRSAELVARTLVEVAARRQLAVRGPVKSRTLERGALVAEARKRGDADVPQEALAGQGILMQAIGWIPPGYDHEQGTAALLEAQLAGFYDPDTKSMFLAADLPGSEAEATLAHELVHALQDQHYDLGPRLKYRAESGDAPVAILSLAEGDATSAMIDAMLPGGLEATSLPEGHMLGLMEAQILGAARTVPTALKASLVAPYLDGVRFVHALRRRGGWAEVDRVWKNPPATTEQLLHLGKYDAHEAALPVPLPDAVAPPSGDYKVTYTDAMGEQGLRITFEEMVSGDEARAAAAGWGGDRVTVLTRTTPAGEEHVVTWWLRFDRADKACRDADEAFEVFRRGILPQGSGSAAGLVCRERPEMGPLAVMRAGCDVLVTAGPFVKAGKKWRSSSECDKVREWVPRAFAQAAKTPGKRVGE